MITENVAALVAEFSWLGFWEVVEPLAMFLLGITIYSIFIFKWYRFVATEDVISFDIHQYKHGWKGLAGRIEDGLFYTIKYLFVFPVLLFFWFVVLTVFLIFLTKSQTLQQILIISMSLIGSIRVTSYYDEDLSKDLAKMMPFALLGVVLIDFSYFDSVSSIAMLLELPSMWKTLLYYFLTIICLEFVLRVLKGIVGLFRKEPQAKDI